jgi:hypothetical protein
MNKQIHKYNRNWQEMSGYSQQNILSIQQEVADKTVLTNTSFSTPAEFKIWYHNLSAVEKFKIKYGEDWREMFI